MGFEPAINFTKPIYWSIFFFTWLKIMKNIRALISCTCWHWIVKNMSASVTSPVALSIAYETLMSCAVVIVSWIKWNQIWACTFVLTLSMWRYLFIFWIAPFGYLLRSTAQSNSWKLYFSGWKIKYSGLQFTCAGKWSTIRTARSSWSC